METPSTPSQPNPSLFLPKEKSSSYTYNGGVSYSSDNSSYGSDEDDDAAIWHYGIEETAETIYYCDGDDNDECGMEVDTEECTQDYDEGDDEILLRQVNKTNMSILVYKYDILHLMCTLSDGRN